MKLRLTVKKSFASVTLPGIKRLLCGATFTDSSSFTKYHQIRENWMTKRAIRKRIIGNSAINSAEFHFNWEIASFLPTFTWRKIYEKHLIKLKLNWSLNIKVTSCLLKLEFQLLLTFHAFNHHFRKFSNQHKHA